MEQAGPDPGLRTALRSLRDIAIPEPVSWLPQTWGWALIAAVLAALCVVKAFRWIQRYRANAYRREALRLLTEIQRLLAQSSTRPDGVRQLGELLKRTALAAWPRKQVASLSNQSWARFLRESDGTVSSSELSLLLDDAEYHGADELEHLRTNAEVIAAARTWIERHHVSA